MAVIRAGRLAEVFVEVADTLVDDFDLIEFLQVVTARSSEFAGALAAGLMLGDHHGQLQFMAASEEKLELLDLFEVQIDEGPCQDSFTGGRPVVNADLIHASDRWPLFAPRAVAAGYRSVHAFPLRLRQQVIGSIGLFGSDPGEMTASDIQIVQALADVATIGLLQARAIHRGEVLAEQLQGALNSRIVIEQAKGVVAQIYHTTVEEAFDLLRSYCRRNHLRLGDVARLIVVDPSGAPNLRS